MEETKIIRVMVVAISITFSLETINSSQPIQEMEMDSICIFKN
jgi:hypothetical protein